MGIRRASIGTTAERTVSNQNSLLPSGGAVSTGISTVVYTDSNYNTLTANAAATTFGTFRILGSNLSPNANVLLANTSAGTIASITSNTTYVSTNEIRANVSVTAGNYALYVFNPNGSAAIYYSGVTFQPYPVWTSTSYGSSATVSVQLLTSSTAVEQPITYSLVSGTLPTGTTLAANGLISGTATGITGTSQTFTFTVSATDIYNETTQASISLTISLADQYFDYTTLLLNGETNTTTYLQDLSPNNFALTPIGAATSNRFSPLWGNGYYGVYNSGNQSCFYAPSNTAFNLTTSNFTIEMWVNPTYYSSNQVIFAKTPNSSTYGSYEVRIVGTSTSIGTVVMYLGSTGSSWDIASAVGTGTIVWNTWNHIALTRSGTTFTLWVNGAASGTVTSSASLYTNTSGFGVGGYVDGSFNIYLGYYSNLRHINGTALYTTNFTPPTSPLTAVANTTLLVAQSNQFIDNGPNAFSLTLVTTNGAPQIKSNQPFNTLPSAVQNYGSALFDGSTGYLNLSNSGGQFSINAPYTFECWYYVTGTSTSVLFGVGGGAGSWSTTSGHSIIISPYQSGNFYLQINTAGTNTNIGGTAPALNQWNHVAIGYNGTTTRIWINGVSLATSTAAYTIPTTNNLAKIGNDASADAPFPGYISNLRFVKGTDIYGVANTTITVPTSPLTAVANTVLLTLQNKNSANNNVFYDDSTNNIPFTRTGTPTQGTFSPFSQTGWSNYFDGSTGFSANTTSLVTGLTNFTIEAWAYTTATGVYQGIFSTTSGSSDGSTGFTLLINNSNHAQISIGNGGTATDIPSSTAIPTGWNHFAAVRNGSSISLYQNGVLVASGTNGTATTTGQLVIGRSYFNLSSSYFSGYVSNVRLSNNVRYSTTFTPSTTPFTSDANTILLSCQSNRFLDTSSNSLTLTPTGTVSVQAFSPFAPGVNYSTANNGGSIYFNGSTDYVVTPSITVGTNNFTIECWIYYTGSSWIAGGIFVSEVSGGIQFNVYSTGGLGIATQGVSYILTSSSGLTMNSWNHVVCVRGGTGSNQTSFYINGVRNTNGTVASNFAAGAYTVGGFYNTGNGTYFPGYISNFKFTNGVDLFGYSNTTIAVPTAPPAPTGNTTLLLLGTNSGIQDATGKNDIITYGSVKTQANTVKFGSGAMYFDGSTGYTLIQNSPIVQVGSSNFTIEYWLYPTTSTTQSPFMLNGNGSGYSIRADLVGSTNYVQLLVSTSGSSWAINSTSSTAVSLNTWSHIAIVRNGTSVVVYLNGTSIISTTISGSVVAGTINYVGASYYSSAPVYFFNGYIDDFRVTNGVARYTGNFTPPSALITQ